MTLPVSFGGLKFHIYFTMLTATMIGYLRPSPHNFCSFYFSDQVDPSDCRPASSNAVGRVGREVLKRIGQSLDSGAMSESKGDLLSLRESQEKIERLEKQVQNLEGKVKEILNALSSHPPNSEGMKQRKKSADKKRSSLTLLSPALVSSNYTTNMFIYCVCFCSFKKDFIILLFL